jgi:hypothetical protein
VQAHGTASSQTFVHGVPQGGSALKRTLFSLLREKARQVIATCSCWCNCCFAIFVSPSLMHPVNSLHQMRNNNNNTFSMSCNNSASHCCMVCAVDLSFKSQSILSNKLCVTCRLGGVLFPCSFPPTLLRSSMHTLLMTTQSASSAART